jgi:hypothetical protein
MLRKTLSLKMQRRSNFKFDLEMLMELSSLLKLILSAKSLKIYQNSNTLSRRRTIFVRSTLKLVKWIKS